MELETLIKLIEKKFNKQDAETFTRLYASDEVRAHLCALLPTITPAEAARAAARISAILAGQAPVDEVPENLAGTFEGLIQLLNLDPNAAAPTADDEATRPQVEGLPEMLLELADLKDRPTVNLPMLTFTPAWARETAIRILLLRASLKPIRSVGKTVKLNLQIIERAARDKVKRDYDMARPYIKANNALAERTERTEWYLYKPAQEGQRTQRINKLRAEEMQRSADTKAAAKAEGAVNSRVADRIKHLLDLAGDDGAEDEAAPPPKPARKTPR